MDREALIQKSALTIDEALQVVGEFGRFQWMLDAAYCIMLIPRSFQILIMFYAALNPTWMCAANSTICLLNGTLANDDYRRCKMPDTEWKYTEAHDFSIVTQFGLSCDKEYLIHLTHSAVFIGWGFGSIVLGYIGDNYGRKTVIFPSLAAIMVLSFITSFISNIYVLILFRFCVGFFIPGDVVQFFVLVTEYVGPKRRVVATIFPMLFLPISYMILTLKAYYIRQWKYLFIACTAPYVLVIPYYCFYRFVPESVRWLRLQNRVDEMMAIFKRMARWNRTEFPEGITIIPASPTIVKHKSNPLDLFRSWKLAVMTICQGYVWFVISMVYYGLSLAADDLGGSLYQNFVLLILMDFPASILAIDFCDRFGRKKTTIIPMVVGAVACVVVGFTPSVGGVRIFRIILGVFGKFAISLSFSVIYLWAAELYPTTLRSEGMGVLQITARVGGATAPWIAKGVKVFHRSAPFIVMGCATFVGAWLALFLQETLNAPISDTQEELERAADNAEETTTTEVLSEVMAALEV